MSEYENRGNGLLSASSARILIVDDERLNIKVLNALLRADYEIMVATSGEEALKLAGSGKPDLILLDVLMPGMDGYEVCRRLKTDPLTEPIPVIFITARSEAEDETMGFDLGAVDYITKPFNFSVIVARVRTHVRLKRQSDLLERLVRCDALTGIPNRRAFDETLSREWERCRRTASPLSLLMIDVDKFKQYNDHYGHGAGDECLRRVAAALAACARRPADLVARYGGEEFAAVLPETDAAGARETAERLIDAVRALALPHASSDAAQVVTISIGLATLVPAAGVALSTLAEAADAQLYQAKEAGRNRACAISI